MDSSIIITFAIPLFFGLILIEFFYGVITKQNNYRINDAITSMSLGLISRFVPILGLGFQYVVYKAVAEHYNLKLLSGDEIWVWVTAFILYDICYVLYVICYIICSMFYVICYMLYVTFYMLYVICYIFHITVLH